MEPELQPLGLGDAMDAAFDLYKRNFLLFAGIVAVVNIPMSFITQCMIYSLGIDQTMSGPGPKSEEQLGMFFIAFGILFLIMLIYSVFYVVQTGALAVAVSERYLGRPISISQSYRNLRGSIAKLFGAWIVASIFIGIAGFSVLFAAIMLLGTLLSITQPASGTPSDTIAMIFGIFGGLAPMAVMLALGILTSIFLTQVSVLEGTGAISAIMRNASLIKGGFMRIFAAALLLFVLWTALGLSMRLSVIGILQISVYSWVHPSVLIQRIVEGVWGGIIALLLQPYFTIALTVLYYDQRVRRDGFDLSRMAPHLSVRQAEEYAA
jgi:hypothetical protein